ncbi:DUF2357 domain-containing protein [Methanobacterium alkalithermotolerans]|uniref:DUF2357 domain-containing protein n=1 Tax=Methanobacterium alkalithermotolerans TaxID=2731220 RepID=A0A8T8K331_9EURY|nr:DUF2357 domain-containing protein [Methanobacterium alkalithermotolerans]QUH22352.1 DUF2357 domain-containing protein [Methanobacterium alkalithermotolerans]
MQQEIIIPLEDQYNNPLGNLSIISLTEVEFNSEFEINNIQYKNVPQVEIPDNTTPIQYCSHLGKHHFAPLMFLEETHYQVLFESKKEESVKFTVLPHLSNSHTNYNPFEPLRFQMDDEHSYRCAGTLNFRSYVGKSFLDVKKDSVRSKSIPIEVRSKKIKYYDQYPAMIADLSEICSALIYELKSPLFQDFNLDYKKKSTLYEDFMLLEYLFRKENLPATYEYLIRNLYSHLDSYQEMVPATYASSVGPGEIIQFLSNGAHLYQSKNTPSHWPIKLKNYMPHNIHQINYQDSVDTPENRFFKYFLESLDILILDLIKKSKEGYVKDKLCDYSDEVGYYLSSKWLKDVGKMEYAPLNSQVLQKREGYRDILKYFLSLELSFRLSWEEISDNFKGYERKLSELYEYWCYFKLLEVLNKLSNKKLDFADIFELNKDEWSINIKKGEKSAQIFNIEVEGRKVKVKLMYNRLFSRNTRKKSYSLPFRPDYSLLIDLDGNIFFIHFDAKYRSEVEVLDFYEKIGSEEQKIFHDLKEANKRDAEEERLHKFKNGDIYKMHTYKDAILKTEGAYVLYPGSREGLFNVVPGEPIPSVGAFPLNPGDNEKEKYDLGDFITAVLLNLINRWGLEI